MWEQRKGLGPPEDAPGATHWSTEQLMTKSVKPIRLPGGPFTPLYVPITAAAVNNGLSFYTEGHRQYRTVVN